MITKEMFTKDFSIKLLGADPNWIYNSEEANQQALLISTRRSTRHSSKWKIGDEEFDVERGNVIIAPPGLAKTGTGNHTFVELIIPKEIYYLAFNLSGIAEDQLPFMISQEGNEFFFDFHLTNMMGDYTERVPGWQLRIVSYIIDLLNKSFLIRIAGQHLVVPTIDLSSKSIVERIQDLVNFISNNINYHFNIAQFPVLCFMTSATFYRTFERIVGMTPRQLITGLRIDKAKLLLSKTQKSITDIAFVCGFSSSQKFSNIFSKNVGMNPREYRNKYGKNKVDGK